MEKTFLELAADLHDRKAILERTYQDLRNLDGAREEYANGSYEAVRVAAHGLRDAIAIIDRLNRLAAAEIGKMMSLEKIKAK